MNGSGEIESPPDCEGSLQILNSGAGDIVVTFDKTDDDEVRKALKMLKDMQKRGYAILVKGPDGTYARAESIDETTCEYVIREKVDGRKKGSRQVRRPIGKTHAVGVARSAGG